MKNFKKEELYNLKGCYTKKELEACSFMQKEVIAIEDIFNSEISFQDKRWFLLNSCDLKLSQKQYLAVGCAEIVLPIFEKQFPQDNRIRECIEATKKYLKNSISKKELLEFQVDAAFALADAFAFADAADDAFAAYNAAAAAYNAIADAAVADDDRVNAAFVRVNNADAKYKNQFIELFIETANKSV